MLKEIKSGPIKAQEGSVNPVRGERTGGEVISQGHGAFNEAVEQGNVYGVCNQTGVATQAGLSATTPVLTLVNPAGSGKDLALWYASFVANVVQAAAESIVWVAVGTNTVAAAVTGTLTTTHRNLKLGAANDPRGIPMLAATLPAAPVGISILGCVTQGAVNQFPTLPACERWFNGSIILTPGTNLSIQTSAVSAAVATLCEYIWEEIPR